MQKFKVFFLLLIISMAVFYCLSNVMLMIPIILLMYVQLIVLTEKKYNKSRMVIKGGFILSSLSLFVVIFLLENYVLTSDEKLSFSYQASIFISFILVIINLALAIIIKLGNIGVVRKDCYIEFNQLDSNYLNLEPINVNPASGLPMKNSIDSVGNVIGENLNDISNKE